MPGSLVAMKPARPPPSAGTPGTSWHLLCIVVVAARRRERPTGTVGRTVAEGTMHHACIRGAGVGGHGPLVAARRSGDRPNGPGRDQDAPAAGLYDSSH